MANLQSIYKWIRATKNPPRLAENRAGGALAVVGRQGVTAGRLRGAVGRWGGFSGTAGRLARLRCVGGVGAGSGAGRERSATNRLNAAFSAVPTASRSDGVISGAADSAAARRAKRSAACLRVNLTILRNVSNSSGVNLGGLPNGSVVMASPDTMKQGRICRKTDRRNAIMRYCQRQ